MTLLRIAVAALILAILMLGWQLVEMRAMRTGMADIQDSQGRVIERMERLAPHVKEGELTTTRTWTSGGVPHSHTVTKRAAETQAEYDARCIDEFAKQIQLYPPD